MLQSELKKGWQSTATPLQQKGWRSIPVQWRFLIVVCLIAGLIFRFVNIEGKVYQFDETFTSLRISGYLESEAIQSLSSDSTERIIGIHDLQQFQRPAPGKSVVDTVRGLLVEEPQLTPFYFVLVRGWIDWFGSSITAVRSLSIIASLLALPCMWWLCVELFETALAGWIGTVILAISPFQVVYAQEACPNSLWATMILLSSAALLRAMRIQTRRNWLLYAVTLTLSFYTFLFSGLVAIAHAAYVYLLERFRINKATIAFSISLVLAVIAFSPWFLAILANMSQVNDVTSWSTSGGRVSPFQFLKVWVSYLGLPFIDRGPFTFPFPFKILFGLLNWGMRLLVLYAFYVLCRKASARVWLFILTLTLLPALALIVPDMLAGGTRSSVPRYVVPSYLGFQLAVTYLLSTKLLTFSAGAGWKQMAWRIVTAVVISSGIMSCIFVAQADSWWSKMISNTNPKMAHTVNATAHPLIISDAGLGDILSLSYYLDPKVNLLIQPTCYACSKRPKPGDAPYLPTIPAGYSDVFLYHPRPSDDWKNRLEKNPTYQFEVLSQGKDNWFWKVKTWR
jgi:uncharacterized membrane protein